MPCWISPSSLPAPRCSKGPRRSVQVFLPFLSQSQFPILRHPPIQWRVLRLLPFSQQPVLNPPKQRIFHFLQHLISRLDLYRFFQVHVQLLDTGSGYNVFSFGLDLCGFCFLRTLRALIEFDGLGSFVRLLYLLQCCDLVSICDLFPFGIVPHGKVLVILVPLLARGFELRCHPWLPRKFGRSFPLEHLLCSHSLWRRLRDLRWRWLFRYIGLTEDPL